MPEHEASQLLREVDSDVVEDLPRALRVERIITPVTAVRCEAVRHAHSLPEKIRAYLEYAARPVSPSLLDKARLLAGVADNADALIEHVKTQLMTPTTRQASRE